MICPAERSNAEIRMLSPARCALLIGALALAGVPPAQGAMASSLLAARPLNDGFVSTGFLPSLLRERVTFASGGARSPRQISTKAPIPRSRRPVVTVTTTGPGQAGFVHYFVIDTPDGERETQIGIELPDERIAWSFPELGVVVSPFIESGQVDVNGRSYPVQHLYGIRPFPDEASMRVLQREISARVAPWIDDATPYCNQAAPSDHLCLSCLGFVMRILFPPRSGAFPSLPSDFEGSGAGLYFTTEDLLLYLTGLQGMRSRAARLRRINALPLPQNLKTDLVELVDAMDPPNHAGSEKPGYGQAASGGTKPDARAYSRPQTRRSQKKKL